MEPAVACVAGNEVWAPLAKNPQVLLCAGRSAKLLSEALETGLHRWTVPDRRLA